MKGFAMLAPNEVGFLEKAPTLAARDALVRPIAVSPCTSDIHTVYEGAIGERHDMILGHEAVGVVVKVGPEVRDFAVGDRVIVPAITPDWGAERSQAGYPMHSGGMLAGWKFSNFKDGVFAECFHVNDADSNLAILPDWIAPEHAVMLCDMATTGLHGAENADIGYGDSVAVIGIGAVGLMALQGAALRGAGPIFAVGTRPVSVKVAKQYGANHIVSYKEGPIDEQILVMTDGQGSIASSSPAVPSTYSPKRYAWSNRAASSATSTTSAAATRSRFRVRNGVPAWRTKTFAADSLRAAVGVWNNCSP